MFGSLGLPEIMLILVLALLIFGPKRLPEVGRTIGKGLAEFRRASSELKRTVNAELALDEDERTSSPRRLEIGGAFERPAAAPGANEPAAQAAVPEGATPRSGAPEVGPESAAPAATTAAVEPADSTEPTAATEPPEPNPAGGER